VRFSNLLPSTADDVVKTQKSIGDIVLMQKDIKTVFSIKLFVTIFCCSQHIEILTKSVSTSLGEMRDFPIFRQVWQTTSLKQKGYQRHCFSEKGYQNKPF